MTLARADAFFAALRAGLLGPTLPGDARQIAFTRSGISQFSSRRGDCYFQSNPPAKPFVQSSPANSVFSAGSGEAQKVLSCNRHRSQASLVFRTLLKACRPPAIIRLITSHRVKTINGMVTARTLPHVGEKSSERTIPALTNSNADRSVFVEVLLPRVGATSLHPKPHSIGRTDKATALMSVLNFSSCGHVPCMCQSTEKVNQK
jgi:hypothetical protein